MKRNIPSFLAGSLTTLLVCSLSISALAISGRMTIEVDPINVQVNGEVFTPTDAKGNAVPVFAYNGTTYAPLRALAEAYGLEVGYDKESNMATVTDPSVVSNTNTPDTTALADYSDWSAEEEAAYQEFKAMWILEEARPAQPVESFPNAWFCKFVCAEDISKEELNEIRDTKGKYLERILLEYTEDVVEDHIMSYFYSESGGFNYTTFKK